ncbi:SUMF1/EgtB/PvdO family nonheme iron enzyme [Micromonospora sp. WMMD1155]|uniref:SUMF1/EgtB/PvdO family nonheme iron enzyme n=1 Tax=Micromonospora sp. WMMD1155 TaxID=3016094 RepID=UPI00249B6CB2|nr:SUMF1/EgtB/PvdO family nonheme iron enzyme [Micromonospora sp. WMMD1155]WFE51171.1 SUMF1/EgtB/PvdO family nonheme iron enzyme [Micromonospora sp. WMMD1155]
MTPGYMRWLADLERPDLAGEPETEVLDISFVPDGARLPGLASLVQRLAARFGDAQDSPPRVTVVVTVAIDAASRVYGNANRAETALAAALHDRLSTVQGRTGLTLVQTLPHVDPMSAHAVEQANAHVAEVATAAGAVVVPVHRVADLDVLTAGEDFPAMAAALEALGRRDRVGYLWNRLVDLAWAHWQALAPHLATAPKVFLTDLDGVLWPGTVAEDGLPDALTVGGLVGQLGHRVWRQHLAGRQRRGVLLAGISKNDPTAAQAALDGVDPAVPLAELWAAPDIDKTAATTSALGYFDQIAPHHAAFIDDNPGQQERLRTAYPALHVPAVAATPLLVTDLFRQLHPGSDQPPTTSDLQRTRYYQARRNGELVPEIVCVEDPTDEETLRRLAQLHARTNQFNMTTPRRTADQLAALVADPAWCVLAFRVTYHGSDLTDEIIGCAEITYPPDGPALLDSFLASCRLLWAGAQRRMFGQVQAVALNRGVKELTARWQPNGRNETYAQWYAHQQWAEPVPDGAGFSFTGTTVTRDGESPDDLLTVMARYLDATLQPAPETPTQSRVRDSDGATEVLVPGGPATLGLRAEDRAVVRSVFGLDPIGEDPRPVDLAPFWMDQHLVSRDMFAAFLRAADRAEQAAAVEATGEQYVIGPVGDARPAFGTGQLPAVVPWIWAQRYALWAGGRLPTEDEWEFAARGTDGRWFPWGAAMPAPPRCLARGSALHTITANRWGTSPFGVQDMTGHVWQWCSGSYRDHPQYRGGDTRANAYFLRATVRPLESAEHCGHLVGFRVVRDAAPEDQPGR